jgi:hypothetical protein
MTKGAPDLAARDEPIAAAERELAAAQSRGRTRPRRSRSCTTASTCPPGRSWPSILIPASAPGRPDPDTALQKQQAAVSTGLPSGSFSTTREKKTLPAAHSEPRETAAATFVTLSVRLVAMSGAAHTDLDAVGDKAFISAPLATRLWADNRVRLITLPRRNARQPTSPPLRRLVNGARQII